MILLLQSSSHLLTRRGSAQGGLTPVIVIIWFSGSNARPVSSLCSSELREQGASNAPYYARQSASRLALVRYHAFSSTARGFIIFEKHRERISHTVSGNIPNFPLDAVTCHSGVCLVVWSPSFWPGRRHRFVKFPILFDSVASRYMTCICPKLMNPLPLREPRKAQRNRDRGPWSPFTPRPRRRCPSPRRTYRQGTVTVLVLGFSPRTKLPPRAVLE